ncbi:MAG: thioether cross-link-forming SCIFF peptide maturase [Ruminococcus sp.]|nr:thioether cross-link-forming SCIFF peptide maturase [Ruminococcus sp.]
MIHKFKLEGYNVLLDVNSGGVHIVDDLTYDVLDNVEPPFATECPENVVKKLSKTYPEKDICDCYDEIVSLYEDKILFSEDDYEKFALASVASPVKALCLLVSQDCNMRCKYCFAAQGDYGTGRKLMSFETGKRALDFLIEQSGSRYFLEVDFFGGEPMLNYDVVKQIVEYGRSREEEANKKFRFTMTTNGLILTDEQIDYLNKEMNNIVLSIDGRKEVNDRMRVLVGGQGTYDKILPNFKRLTERRDKDKDWYVRGTYTKYNLDFSNDIMHFHDLGFEQISVEPVIADPKEPYAITEADLPKIFKEYEVLSQKIRKIREEGKFINFFHFMIDLDQGPCAIKRLRGCGSGNEYVAISPEGDIYPCHQFVGIEDMKMGNINEGTFDLEKKDEFAHAHVYTKPECKKCWAKFYCSGGCNANNYIYNGDIHAAHKLSCQIQKKRLECAILMKALELMDTAE